VPIEVGERIPSEQIQITEWSVEKKSWLTVTMDSAVFFGAKKVVLFGVPGAFTPTCSDHHLPAFVSAWPSLLGAGVDLVACIAAQDVFVLRAWSERHQAQGKVVMVGDANGRLLRAMGLLVDASSSGMVRVRRR